MRVALLWSVMLVGAGCGAAQRLPPDVGLMARYDVMTRGVPGGAALRRVVVVQDEVNGPRIDRAVAEALRRTGRTVELLPPGTTGVETAARTLKADAVVRLSLRVRRESRGQGSERQTVTRNATGFTTYIAPPTPIGQVEGALYPSQRLEHATVEFPVDMHFIDALVGVQIVRAADGEIIASWRQDLGAYKVARPTPAPRAAPGSQPLEQEPPAWGAVLAEAGGDLARWVQAPKVEVSRPLWLVRKGPPAAVAATRQGLDAAAGSAWEAAEAAFRTAVAAAPGDPRTHANLAVALERRGDRAAAYAELKAAARLERGEARFANVLHDFNRTYLPAAAPHPGPASAPARANEPAP
ncbi:MAG TPA: hypothetical protein VGQ83_27085 [Polyangia bacterium]|jgi:hypothetical protein